MSRDPIDRWTEKAAKVMNAHGDRLSAIENFLRNKPLERDVNDRNLQFVQDMAQRQLHYANTVLLLGYGGFFALWTSTHGVMPPWLFGICGALISISLVIFVGMEMAKTKFIGRVSKEALSKDATGNQMSAIEARNHIVGQTETFDARYHAPCFWGAAATGFAAGLLMLGFFIVHMTTAPVAAPRIATENAQTEPSPARPPATQVQKKITPKPLIDNESATN